MNSLACQLDTHDLCTEQDTCMCTCHAQRETQPSPRLGCLVMLAFYVVLGLATWGALTLLSRIF